MHRSGTSLLASAVLRAGIDMGSALMQAGRGNRRGHFEDLAFYHFHERFLERREISPFALPDGWSPDPTAVEDAEARALVSPARPLWGFKDPKAALFLDFWDQRLPSPLYLFVYRHPVEVALSLLRRGLELEIQQDPRVAIRAWMAYNERLLAFRSAHPDRCLLWHLSGVTRSVHSLDSAVGSLEERLGAPLKRADWGSLFHPDELRSLCAREIDWPALLPDAFELYRRLEEAADLPGARLEAERTEPERTELSRGERELLETNEHLLAAVYGTACSVTASASTATLRNDYTRLRLLSAQQAEDTRGHEAEKANLAERLRLLSAQRAEDIRRYEEDLRRHQEDLRRNQEDRTRLEQARAMLAERLRRVEEDQVRLESTGAWRAVQSYWSTARRVQSWQRGVKWGIRRLLRGSGSPRPEEVVIGCVAENAPRFLAQACRLVRSIRWFGGSLSGARVLVCVVEGVDPRVREDLEAHGAEVRIVPRFDARNPFANKLQFFEAARGLSGAPGGPGVSSTDFFLLLDCDTVVVRDPLPLLRRGVFQAKIADLPTVTHEVFEEVFRHCNLPLPPRRHATTFGRTPTIRYCNSGVIGIPADLAGELVPVWRQYNARLAAELEVLGPCATHCNQASLALALGAHPVPFREAPLALNFPLHLTYLEPPPEMLSTDPAILHYHAQVDADGCLLPAPYPLAQARIEELNRRLADERMLEAGVRLGEPAQLAGLPAQLRETAGADELLVEAVGGLGIAPFEPVAGRGQDLGLPVAGR